MEVHFTPEIEKKLKDLAARRGRPADELVQNVVAGYVDEMAHSDTDYQRAQEAAKRIRGSVKSFV